jgi:hypothetical protein
MGWVMLFVGLLLPVPIGLWLIGKRHANVPLSLIGLVSLPLLIWAASLAAKIGPCDTGGADPCMSSSEHSRLLFSLPALALLLVAFGLLAFWRLVPAAAAMIVGLILAAISVTKTDTPIAITFAVLAAGAAAYLVSVYAGRETSQVPDYPPPV